MNILTIEKFESSQRELIAKLNGIDLPNQVSITITSNAGETTKVTIVCVVGMFKDDEGILIKEAELHP